MRQRRSTSRELLPSHGQCTQAWSNTSLLMDKFGDRTAASINGYSRYPGRYAAKETNAAPAVADIGPQSHRASRCQFGRNEAVAPTRSNLNLKFEAPLNWTSAQYAGTLPSIQSTDS